MYLRQNSMGKGPEERKHTPAGTVNNLGEQNPGQACRGETKRGGRRGHGPVQVGPLHCRAVVLSGSARPPPGRLFPGEGVLLA